MEWTFLDIFKKAEFNTLMVSAAITGWLLYFFYPNSNYAIIFIGIAILCSIYSIIRIIKLLAEKTKALLKRRKEKKEKEIQIKLAAENDERKKKGQEASAQFVYDRLSPYSQVVLQKIVAYGEKSTYQNAYILRKNEKNDKIILSLKNILFDDKFFTNWVNIDETYDMVCVYFKPPLNDIVEKQINTDK